MGACRARGASIARCVEVWIKIETAEFERERHVGELLELDAAMRLANGGPNLMPAEVLKVLSGEQRTGIIIFFIIFR